MNCIHDIVVRRQIGDGWTSGCVLDQTQHDPEGQMKVSVAWMSPPNFSAAAVLSRACARSDWDPAWNDLVQDNSGDWRRLSITTGNARDAVDFMRVLKRTLRECGDFVHIREVTNASPLERELVSQLDVLESIVAQAVIDFKRVRSIVPNKRMRGIRMSLTNAVL